MSTENLSALDARKKLKELAEGIDFAFMATNLSNQGAHAIPMSTKSVDDAGDIWFLSNKNSTHNQHINEHGVAQLFYCKPGSMEFLNVFGKATISTDKSIIDKLYGKSDDNWFEGKDDPNITALRITPTDAHYWEPKSNALVSLVKMGVGLVTGKTQDIGAEGELKVN